MLAMVVTVMTISPRMISSQSSNSMFIKVNGKGRGLGIGREPDLNSGFATSQWYDPKQCS